MSAISTTKSKTEMLAMPRWAHWFPVLALTTGLLLIAVEWPPVLAAWSLAFVLYAGFKWLTLANSRAARSASLGSTLGYLFLWPGMDADAFFTRRSVPLPTRRETILASVQLALGLALVLTVPMLEPYLPTLIAGSLGLLGLALFLLFGFARLVSIAWRSQGIDAQPIMDGPLFARSLTEFWGARWNLAFHDVGRIHILHPLHRRVGHIPAVFAVFLFSGLVHDLVMSVPVRAGLGLPTLYFLLQAGGVLWERSSLGKRLGLSRGWFGRFYAALVVLLPVGLLFHQPFLTGVILPTLAWLVGR